VIRRDRARGEDVEGGGVTHGVAHDAPHGVSDVAALTPT
jgi:hypothetical protein